MSEREAHVRFGRTVKIGVVAAALLALSVPQVGAPQAFGSGEEEFGKAVVHTDGHLRPGHFETIWVKGFPGRGRTEVAFFPTAICEEECSSAERKGGRTDARGAAKFRVRIPGTFFNSKGKRTYFRNRERIELEVLWFGPNKDEFDVGSAEPEPIIVRTHRK